MSERRRPRSKSADYLDALAATLRELGGPTTIPHELTQNADDAENVTRIRFNVTNDELVVWNDGRFTDCLFDDESCAWDPVCNLHAFGRFAGRTKANDASSTGAFGVGFTSVYQITDAPELLYDDEHWFIDEMASAEERLRPCTGACRRSHGDGGTTFVLPWARSSSQLRAKLAVPEVDESTIDELEQALVNDAARTLLFLRHITAIDVVGRRGECSLSRRQVDGGFAITNGPRETRWLSLTADFSEAAQPLLERAAGLINAERPTEVTIAIPMSGELQAGVLYATLPTQSPSGLPGHVNASFYPKTDRKSVRFETGYHSDWNRTAISAVGRGLTAAAPTLVESIGIDQFWEVLGVIADIDRRSIEEQTNHASTYLASLCQVVPDLPVVATIDGGRTTPRSGLLPSEVELYDASSAFIALGLPVVAQHLHRRLHTNSVYNAYQMRQLTARHVVEALLSSGIVEPFTPANGPLTADDVVRLLAALERLPGRIGNVNGIGDVAIVPCRSGVIAPASRVVWPDTVADAALFEMLVEDLLIADVELVERHAPGLRDSCTLLDIVWAAQVLHRVDRESLIVLSDELLDWLSRNLTPGIDAHTRDLLANLPVFPTASGFDSLVRLSLPNEFRDPIGVASLVHDRIVRDHHKLLTGLGAKPLNIVDYFRLHALPAVEAERVSPSEATELLRLVGIHQDELGTLHAQLKVAKLIPCTDGALHAPSKVHLPSRDMTLLAPELPIANTMGVAPALDWLAVRSLPSDEALRLAVDRLSYGEVDPDVHVVEAVLRTLQARDELPEEPPSNLSAQRWLPLRRGGRARPSAVLPTNARQLYGDQGAELGLPAEIQGRFFRQLTWLGMPSEPPVATIVAHLRNCADTGKDMHSDVYRVLGNNAGNTLVRSLRDIACVYVGSGRFVLPTTAFWQPSPFGRWGVTLPEAWLSYKPFFDAVGVKQEAGPAEVVAVLRSILEEYGNDQLDEMAGEVVHGCWAKLSELLEHPEAPMCMAALGHIRSTMEPRGLLARPDQLFFEDSRSLHTRFPQLAHNVIPRVRGTWRALTQSGVRRVEELIKAKLVDVDAERDNDLPSRIGDRLSALHRVFDDEDVLEDLQALKVLRAPRLTVKYRAELFGQSFVIGPEHVDAIYLPDEEALYYSDGASARALARELARAIAPDDDPGPLAMRLEPILSADSAERAHSALDDFGIAKLDISNHEVEWAPRMDAGDVPIPLERQKNPDSGPDPEEDASAHDKELGNSQDVEGMKRTSGDEASGASNRPGETRKNMGSSTKGRRTGREMRLRSYVVDTDEDEGDLGSVGEEAPDLSPIDLAGVERVLEYEGSCGRDPRGMAHANAGFDVESFDVRGDLVRRIEIKSTGGQWSVRGVMLSRRQHQQAAHDRDLFWLYVVENAEEDDFRIYRIQDPASRIDYFGFDGGWKGIAEPDVERDDSGTPTAAATRGHLRLSPGQAGAV